ncbi:MAG: hypothetical protein VW644_01230 [Alphaproteobacteria bacterium]
MPGEIASNRRYRQRKGDTDTDHVYQLWPAGFAIAEALANPFIGYVSPA